MNAPTVPLLAPPAATELADLMARFANRFPEPGRVTLPGDGGASVSIPLLIGIPSGAVKQVDGAPPPARAWAVVVAEALGFSKASSDLADLANDCVLWPSRAVLAQLRERWASVDGPIVELIKRKIGYVASAYQDLDGQPFPEGWKPPSPAGLVRVLAPAKGVERIVAVDPLPSDDWRFYVKSAAEDGCKAIAERTREAVDALTHNVASDVLDRWPGLVLSLAKTGGYLAGVAAEVQLGNW